MGSSSGRFNTLDGQNIPQYVDAHKATLTFPEKLMYMIMEVDRSYVGHTTKTAPIAWVNQGTVIVLRDEDELVRKWLPQFFEKSIKLSSFLRKCYRWGFRRLSLASDELTSIQPLTENAVYICCRWFQRDNQDLMYNMESKTSVKTRTRHARHFSPPATTTTCQVKTAVASVGRSSMSWEQPAAQDPTAPQPEKSDNSLNPGSASLVGPLFPPSQQLVVHPQVAAVGGAIVGPPQLQGLQIPTSISLPIIMSINQLSQEPGRCKRPATSAAGSPSYLNSSTIYEPAMSGSPIAALVSTIPTAYPAQPLNMGVDAFLQLVPQPQRSYTSGLGVVDPNFPMVAERQRNTDFVNASAIAYRKGLRGADTALSQTNLPSADNYSRSNETSQRTVRSLCDEDGSVDSVDRSKERN